MGTLLKGVPVDPNEHCIKRGANFFKVIELLTQLKRGLCVGGWFSNMEPSVATFIPAKVIIVANQTKVWWSFGLLGFEKSLSYMPDNENTYKSC